MQACRTARTSEGRHALALLQHLVADRDLALDEPLPEQMPIRRSVTDDHIVCLEDGKKLTMLKRHLMTEHGLTPQA